ncbi:hypothetical protein ASC76_19190 [Rhizobacter sp. Root404]|nr:hypothetical protein ASC76_19190 [Rhizobacter sp. Root404]
MDGLHGTVANILAKEVQTKKPIVDCDGKVIGEMYDKQMLSLAIKFLKDNNITGVAKEGNALQALRDAAASTPFGAEELGQTLPPQFNH